MHERQRTGGRSRSTPLPLVALLGAVMVVAAGIGGYEVGTIWTAAPGGQVSASPLADAPTVWPPVTVLPEPDVDRSSPSSAGWTAQEAEAPEPTTPMTMPAAAPVRVQIPAIGVDSKLMDLGLRADGTLEVPPGAFPAGWYTGAPTPGELGPAIIAGHVDWGGQPGVFFDLRDLSPGAKVAVIRQDGSTARFRVTRVERFDKDEFPTQAVYGDLDHAGLRLITCGGSFDPQARSYDENLVVFAELVGSDAAPSDGEARGSGASGYHLAR